MWSIGLRLALVLSLTAYVFRSVRSDYLESPSRNNIMSRLKYVGGITKLQRKAKSNSNAKDATDENPAEENQREGSTFEQENDDAGDEDVIDNNNNNDHDNNNNDNSPSFLLDTHPMFREKGMNIKRYLNDHVLDNQDSIQALQDRLEMGQVVLIPNAFDADFAQAMHDELFHKAKFTLSEGYHSDGYTHMFHTVPPHNQSSFLRHVNHIFSSVDSRTFLTDFTDLDCLGDTIVEPSYHAPGNFENPYTADEDQHNVAFTWLLSKDWQPEWGGALYWCPETPEFSYVHATFNTLVLFKVTRASQHMITQVSRHATSSSKRLAYNGFWTSGWVPEVYDDLEEQLVQNGDKLTRKQFETIEDLLVDGKEAFQDDDRWQQVKELYEEEYEERYPNPRYIFEIDANTVSTGIAGSIISES
jgi:hypothetical protein